MTSLVFDATALSHFARAGRMDELRTAVADDEPVLLAEVAAELAPHNHKSEQADAEWGDLRIPQPSGDYPGQRK